ncbi:hypothetical protein Pmani_029639 [Petrolisthes manimaculis]|uniref:BTB domain-containing protein n=1 Tax=Petrolisthes manimaculis TaxID=1843537 RepID=A0AAE1TTN5_9EUCA|nr:hypothetical protein Pmani_029639 [Petrolisthes manimaculis]
MGTFQKFCLRWNNHTTNLLGTLGHILTSEQHSDVTLCCQGEVWRLHKLVLCASSSHFEKLLGGLPPGTSPILVLDGPHPHDVASLIHFIYHGEVNVDQENLASLLRTAESLKIKGLAEVSSVTSGGERKIQTDGDCPREHLRGRLRPNHCPPPPVYTLGNEYPVGMYGFIPHSISPHTQVPDPLERDPSPLNLSFSGTLKNIHDETPQERQERRNRLDDLLYAATERSKKEERREARREAREAALREAAAVRDTSTTPTQDQPTLPPPLKRPRTCDSNRNYPTHPAFHIPLENLSLPSGALASVTPTHSVSSTQISQPPQPVPLVEEVVTIVQNQEVQYDHVDNQDTELARKSPCKSEKIDISSDGNNEEVTVNIVESETQSAPDTPSESSSVIRTTQVIPPTTTTVATQVSCTGTGDSSNLPPSCVPTVNTPQSNAETPSQVQPSDTSEEKVTPYYHSILQQVAEGSTGTETSSISAQRVTINMRTFKEEWRRQLLVDYDTRTNMSICMLCFTTFKSYDGPRKNTYVKHAKRFHPSLEEYSEQERDLIINMYEKYHKYDVDMQKEVNKSYRAANAIVALGKKGIKHCETTAEVTCTSDLNVKATTDVDGIEENKEVGDGTLLKEEESACNSGKSRSHTPESDVSLETNEKFPESSEPGYAKEKLENNNISTAPHGKRNQINSRSKSAASTTTVVV